MATASAAVESSLNDLEEAEEVEGLPAMPEMVAADLLPQLQRLENAKAWQQARGAEAQGKHTQAVARAAALREKLSEADVAEITAAEANRPKEQKQWADESTKIRQQLLEVETEIGALEAAGSAAFAAMASAAAEQHAVLAAAPQPAAAAPAGDSSEAPADRRERSRSPTRGDDRAAETGPSGLSLG